MSASTHDVTATFEPANERFKTSARNGTWVGMLLATGIHLLVFLLWPSMTVEIRAESATAVEVVPVPEVNVPDRPAPPRPPAAPVVVEGIDTDVTIPPTTVDSYVPTLAPPPGDEGGKAEAVGRFAPVTTNPQILNPEEVARRLQREYPPTLRDAGVGGEVLLHLHIDENGELVEARISGSSGLQALDRAALRVSEAFRFSPALNRDTPVPVWVALPVLFEIR